MSSPPRRALRRWGVILLLAAAVLCLWLQYGRGRWRRPAAKSWGGSIDNPTPRDSEALWNYAVPQSGQDVVPLEDFLQTREANGRQ